jgi:hypothetical protein
MSDAMIFIVGAGVFAVTTTATLLYGYSWFNEKSVEAGVEDGSEKEFETDDTQSDDVGEPASLLSVPVDIGRVYRQLPLTRSA